MAGCSRQHGSSGGNEDKCSRLRLDSFSRLQGWELHPGKDSDRNAGAQGAGGGVERRKSPGDHSGIPGRGRPDYLIKELYI